MRANRVGLLQELEKTRETKVIVYVTGDRQGLETQIHPEVVDFFVHHLDLIGPTKRLTLFLHTCGGSALASWSIATLLRSFCDELEVVVPSKAQSGGTLICLGADKVVMTKQARLGPIDPQVNGPLNPAIAGNPQGRAPVGVEEINHVDAAHAAGPFWGAKRR
jgi:ClpP class serine protease